MLRLLWYFFLCHPVEMLPVLAAAFVSVLLTVQFFCVYKWVKQLSGEKPMVDGAIHECMDGHMSVFTPCIHNIQGVCINTCSKYPCGPMFLLYWLIIVDVCNIHQLLCWICNALKKNNCTWCHRRVPIIALACYTGTVVTLSVIKCTANFLVMTHYCSVL